MGMKSSSLFSLWLASLVVFASLLVATAPSRLVPDSALAASPPGLAWDKTFGGPSNDSGNSVRQTADGGYVIAGYTGSHGAGYYDVWLIKTDASGNKQWDKTFGGPSNDSGNSVQQTADGGYIIAGYTASYGAGGDDIWLIKTDASGNKQWDKTFGGPSNDSGNSVQQTADGGYVIAGYTASYGAGGEDIWLIKTDASGNKQWDKTFGGSLNDDGYSVQQSSDGGYVVAGLTFSYGAGGDDVWLIKTDASGNKQWDKTFGGASADFGNSVQQTADGGYVVAGYTSGDFWLIKTDASGNKQWDKTFGGSDTDAALCVQQTADGGYVVAGWTFSYGAGGDDVWLIKTDASGNKLWDKTFGGTYIDWATCVEQTLDGGYVIAGYTKSYGAGDGDLWLIKTDASGNKLWDETFGGQNDDIAYSARETADGGYVVVGYTESYGAGSNDAWLIKTDASGNELWNRTFGGANDDGVSSVQQTADGGYVLAGWTASYGAGYEDAWLIKTDASGNKLWDRTFGGGGRDLAFSMEQTADEGFVIAGATSSYGAGSWDVWLIKTDASGNKQWDKTFGGTEGDQASSVQQTADGGYVVAATTGSYGAGNNDAWLIKMDASGNKQWDKTFGGLGDDEAHSVQQTVDGGYVLSSWTASYGAGSNDAWLIKTDASGNKQWDKTLGGANDDRAYSVQQTVDGGYMLSGWTVSYGAGGSDAWLIKTDASGNKQWDETFGGTGADATWSVQQTADEGYVIAGYTMSYGAGGWDFWLIKTTGETIDTVPPSAITDLAASNATSNSVTLTWTAPGDDGNTGTASTYDIRYSTSAITDANWASASKCSGEATPKVAGSAETFTVAGLTPTTLYYFAIKTADEVPNWSGLSNVVSKQTDVAADATPPAAVTDLAATAAISNSVILTWTAPGDDGNTGTASTYDIRYSTVAITDGNWASGTQCNGEPAPKVAGSAETFNVNGLLPNTTYYFALKTVDEIPNWSSLSNVVSKQTQTVLPPLVNHPPITPTNVSPSDGQKNVTLGLTLVSSLFLDADSADTHAASQWQIRADSGSYSSRVFDSGIDASNLTSIAISWDKLSYGATYYWRVQYQDSAGAWSGWSSEKSFSTLSFTSSAFKFAVITDIHMGYESYDYAERLKDIVDKINTEASAVAFVAVLGDITHDGETSDFNSAKEALDRLKMPYIPLIGNHDVLVQGSGSRFNETFASQFEKLEKTFGGEWRRDESKAPMYLENYAFRLGGVKFICIDSASRNAAAGSDDPIAGPDGNLYGETKNWLGVAMRKDERTVILSHHPLLLDSVSAFGPVDLEAFQLFAWTIGPTLLADFAGHNHMNHEETYQKVSMEVVTTEAVARENIPWYNPYTPTGDCIRLVSISADGGIDYSHLLNIASSSPIVSSLSPNEGDRGKTLTVTITGFNFAGATDVDFGSGITINNFSVNSNSEITAAITIDNDATRGSRDVTVTTGGGTWTEADGFTVAGGGGGICGAGELATPGAPSEMTTTLAALGVLFGVGYLLLRRRVRNRTAGVQA